MALLITFLFNRKKENPFIENFKLPLLTVQLPVFNERFVIKRLLDAVEALNYPKSLLEIQILDDSTDDTKTIVSKRIEELKELGFNIGHILRSNREGYKAGALQNGLFSASGQYIVIFDADFVPHPDFLIDTLPYFTEEKIGMVQTRWGHLNAGQSLLTRAQRTGLNNHFIIDQEGRNKGGYFINFNGTAGIWRKECILDAGGWKSDTLTEDLDLSFRAQIKGWKFKYCPNIITPAELPDRISAVRTQQFRWTKGGVETSKKLLGRLWKAELSLAVKLFGSIQLLNNFIYAFILISALISVPLMFVKNLSTEFIQTFKWNAIITAVMLINFLYCFTAILVDKKKFISALIEVITAFPIAMVLSLGMSYHNTKAIIHGLIGKKTAFIRTPKISESIGKNPYIQIQNYKSFTPEFLLSIYFLFAVFSDIYFRDFGFLIYHVLMLSGFGFVIWSAWTEASEN
ncbi:MAG: glycosyltransferase [Daejeonella sp.]|uniref:cellulose synthase family protein n=1 Tax=Daejeonella sp. TaxID=2805397 RepID=UPI002736F395|nr:glycosyltransferase [Daejeonella sp.]MDP3469768.1 glycosyltransferase [Daejeonella sp.]